MKRFISFLALVGLILTGASQMKAQAFQPSLFVRNRIVDYGYLNVRDTSAGGSIFAGALTITGKLTLSGGIGVTGLTDSVRTNKLTVNGTSGLNGSTTQIGTTLINASGAANTTIGYGGTGAVTIGNTTGNILTYGTITSNGAVTVVGADTASGRLSSADTVYGVKGGRFGGALTTTGTNTFYGSTVVNGGITFPSAMTVISSPAGIPDSTVRGIDIAFSGAGHVLYSQIYIPYNVTITGVTWESDSTSGADSAMAYLFNSTGTMVAQTARNSGGSGGQVIGTSLAFKSAPFTGGTYAATPGLYYIGIQSNGTTSKLRGLGTANQKFWTGDYAGSFGSCASITQPSANTASIQPYVQTY